MNREQKEAVRRSSLESAALRTCRACDRKAAIIHPRLPGARAHCRYCGADATNEQREQIAKRKLSSGHGVSP